MIMKLRDDQVRLQGLLKETITLLCKNGLHFKNGFCVEALIGITTDDSDVFLVNIKESIGSVGADADDGQHDTSKQGDGDHGDDGRSRGSRKRPPDGGTRSTPMKRSRSDDDESDYDSDASDNDDTNVKREPDEDLVFVKQELSDYDPQNTAQFAQPGQAHQSFGTQDASFDGSHDGSTSGSAWNQSTANQSTANMDPNQMALQAQSQSGSQQAPDFTGGGVICQICQTPHQDIAALNEHYTSAHPPSGSQKPFRPAKFSCEICDKKYRSKQTLKLHLLSAHSLKAT